MQARLYGFRAFALRILQVKRHTIAALGCFEPLTAVMARTSRQKEGHDTKLA
jgi:hypothetical protein